jgi:linoleate 8R-lipoxygenase/9,12-octadecadienoate 8-hydroperoxide 8R-isomerase
VPVLTSPNNVLIVAAFDSGIPKVMRVIEILGINQSRYWKTATLNEFRKFFGLPPHKTFEDMNPDPEKVKALLHFYGHPDNVELYPGLIVEDVKSPNPGWLPPVTLSRAIFSDGLSLLRGDRFYTLVHHLMTI